MEEKAKAGGVKGKQGIIAGKQLRDVNIS